MLSKLTHSVLQGLYCMQRVSSWSLVFVAVHCSSLSLPSLSLPRPLLCHISLSTSLPPSLSVSHSPYLFPHISLFHPPSLSLTPSLCLAHTNTGTHAHTHTHTQFSPLWTLTQLD